MTDAVHASQNLYLDLNSDMNLNPEEALVKNDPFNAKDYVMHYKNLCYLNILYK